MSRRFCGSSPSFFPLSHIIVTGGDDKFEEKHAFELDFILTTVDSVDGLPLDKLIKCLNGTRRVLPPSLPFTRGQLTPTLLSLVLPQSTELLSPLESPLEVCFLPSLPCLSSETDATSDLPFSDPRRKPSPCFSSLPIRELRSVFSSTRPLVALSRTSLSRSSCRS